VNNSRIISLSLVFTSIISFSFQHFFSFCHPNPQHRSLHFMFVKRWTPKEDEKLLHLMEIHGKEWWTISSEMKTRTASQISCRWERSLDPNLVKGPFTPEEDKLIRQHVNDNGPTDWIRVAAKVGHRSGKQCRERWFNHLNPVVSHADWTLEEDTLISEGYERWGPKWTRIAATLPGRTDNAIKNRWRGSIKNRVRTDSNGIPYLAPERHRRRPKRRTLSSSQSFENDVVDQDSLLIGDDDDTIYFSDSF
jgi:hypothetical protein